MANRLHCSGFGGSLSVGVGGLVPLCSQVLEHGEKSTSCSSLPSPTPGPPADGQLKPGSRGIRKFTTWKCACMTYLAYTGGSLHTQLIHYIEQTRSILCEDKVTHNAKEYACCSVLTMPMCT